MVRGRHCGREESTPSCDPDHLTVVALDARLGAVMGKKAIAAVLLLTITAWAEMAMAPMLAMHAGHMHPGREMAADMPAEHAAHHHAENAQMAEHPCCPALHRAESEAALTLATGAPTCDDPHSCCFRQGPQSVPAPASKIQELAREMVPTSAAKVSPTDEASARVINNKVFAFGLPPDLFGMTFRV